MLKNEDALSEDRVGTLSAAEGSQVDGSEEFKIHQVWPLAQFFSGPIFLGKKISLLLGRQTRSDLKD